MSGIDCLREAMVAIVEEESRLLRVEEERAEELARRKEFLTCWKTEGGWKKGSNWIKWRALRDSNPQPPDPKSGALSVELRARSIPW